jgi:hypothetical protein
MVQNIFRARIEIDKFSSGDSRLFIEFANVKGQERGELQWTPVWRDVGQLMVQAVEVERQNKPGSTYLEQFANICSEVVTKYAPAEHAKIMGGRCIEYWVDRDNSKSFIKVLAREITDRVGWIASEEVWELAVPLSEEKLRNLINAESTWLIWNGKVIEIH